MELYQEILSHALQHGKVTVTFPGDMPDIAKILEGACYQTLQKIKAVIHDDSLEDDTCFMKIEAIICALEDAGIHCGARHDFG